jgi:serine/threonine-protein kinase
MDPDQIAQLVRGLFAGRPADPALLAHAHRAAAGCADAPALGDKLGELGLLTRYQAGKLRHNRLADVLFGPYLICEKIGEGGMGKVYRAVHMVDGNQVALKVVRPHLISNAIVQKRYAREAKAAAAFDHPNIIKLLAEDTVDGRYYLAMEYIDGSDLSRLVKEFGKPPDKGLPDYREAVEYIRQAALGLQHAHDRGFVHRDVKPSNLLAYGQRALPEADGPVGLKILDMGLVRRLMGENDDNGGTELTRDGTVVGTPDYMSPEQAKDSKTVDARADLYSLGCTLYFLLHGRPPFDGGSPIDKLLKHHTEPPPDPRAGRPDVPAELARLILRLMKKKPDDRFQTAAAVADALRPFGPWAAPVPVTTGIPFELSSPAPEPLNAEPVPAAPQAKRVLKVRQPTAVPAAVPGARADATPSEDAAAALRRSSSFTNPVLGPTTARRPQPPPAPKPPDDITLFEAGGPETPPPARRPSPQRRRQEKQPVWPMAAAGAGGMVLLLALVLLLMKGCNSVPRPAAAPPPEPAPVQPPRAAARPVADLIADGAVGVLIARPKPLAARLPADAGRFAAVVRDLAKWGVGPDRTDRLVVSLTGRPGQLVAAADPGPAVGTDPTATTALTARLAAGRGPVQLTAELTETVRKSGASPLLFVADAGFALPGGDALGRHRVSLLSVTAAPDGDRVALDLTLVGPDRDGLTEFVRLELCRRLPAAEPAFRPLCDRLAAIDQPVWSKPGDKFEAVFRLTAEWAEVLAVADALCPAE